MRTHDILQFDPGEFRLQPFPGDTLFPSWVAPRLKSVPFVTVRRGEIRESSIPVGIRGEMRNERSSAILLLSTRAIPRIISPIHLACLPALSEQPDRFPAMQALLQLRHRWADRGYLWGPIGSVGFELATGTRAVRHESDLDIVLYIDHPFEMQEAASLLQDTQNLKAAVDVRVETRSCGFSLKEYVHGRGAKMLLRTPHGPVLGNDPWFAVDHDRASDIARVPRVGGL